MRSITHFTLGLALAAAFVCGESAAFAQKKGGGGPTPPYTIVELAHRQGRVFGINASGTCVGQLVDVDGLGKPYLWYVGPAGVVEAVPLPRLGLAGYAHDINDDGLTVGGLIDAGGQGHAAYWPDPDSDPVLLPVPSDVTLSVAIALNDDADGDPTTRTAVVVGLYIADDVAHCAAWGLRADATISGPVALAVGPNSAAVAVNDSQTVVGTVEGQAARWQLAWDGADLVNLGGGPLFAPGQYVNSSAYSINDDGDIGGTRNPGGRAEAWFLDRVGDSLVDQPLPLLVDDRRNGSVNEHVHALNNANPPQLVGAASTYSKRYELFTRFQVPVLWEGATILDLQQESSSPTLTAGRMEAINDSGWIAGWAWTGETEINRVPAVLIPTP